MTLARVILNAVKDPYVHRQKQPQETHHDTY